MRQLFILLLLMPMFAFSQSRFSGIGPFRINSTTTSIIDSIAKTKGEFKEINDALKMGYPEPDHYEAIYNFEKPYQSPSYASACPNVRVFYLKSTVVSAIVLKNIYIVFFNDTLKEMHLDYSSDIEEAMKLKYGEPKVKIERPEKTFVNKTTGNEFTLEEMHSYQTWANEEVTGILGLSKRYDNHAKEKYFSFFSISANGFNEVKSKCEKENKAKLEAEQKGLKKASLSDF